MTRTRRAGRAAGFRAPGGAVLSAMALLVAACGGDTTGPDGDDGTAQEVNLSAGESQVVTPASSGVLRFRLPGPGASGAEYRVVVQSAATEAGATSMQLQISAAGGASSSTTAASAGAASRTLRGGDWQAGRVTPAHLGLIEVTEFQRRTNEMLARRGVVPARRTGATPEVDASRDGPRVTPQFTPGEIVSLRFPVVDSGQSGFGATCNPDSAPTIHAEVMAEGQRAVMLEDTTTTSGTLGSGVDYQALADEFDQFVFGSNVAYFGQPTDIDGNQRVMVLFTPRVNDLSDPNSEARVSGFFLSSDLAENGDGDTDGADNATCEAGNEAELLYLLAPDPNGDHAAGGITAVQAERNARSTSAHEFQHLLNAANRLIRQGGTFVDTEETWLNEALSHVAEEIVGLSKQGESLRSNLSAPDVREDAAERETFDTFHASNFTNVGFYFENPSSTQAIVSSNDPGGTESLKMRGFAWMFARWLADQENAGSPGSVPGSGDPEEAFFRSLAKADGQNLDVGIQNVENVTGRSWPALLSEFAAMPTADDDVAGVAERHTLLTWNMRQIFQTFPLTQQSAGFASGSFGFTLEPGAHRFFVVSSSGSAPDVVLEVTDQTGQPLTTGSPQVTIVRAQ